MARYFGSQSMVVPLRTVLVKRPEQAFAVSDPVAWHYTGRPDVKIAQQEHDALVALLLQLHNKNMMHWLLCYCREVQKLSTTMSHNPIMPTQSSLLIQPL